MNEPTEPDWKEIAVNLAHALQKLDALYRAEQDEPGARPDWLQGPMMAFCRASEVPAEETPPPDRQAVAVVYDVKWPTGEYRTEIKDEALRLLDCLSEATRTTARLFKVTRYEEREELPTKGASNE